MDADKNLAKNLEEKKVLEIENAHKKEKVSIIIYAEIAQLGER